MSETAEGRLTCEPGAGSSSLMSSAPASTTVGDLIIEDRPCTSCGYNLKGLRVGGPCPECGQMIALSRRRLTHFANEGLLGEAPKSYLYLLMLGLSMMGLSIASAPVALPLMIRFFSGANLMVAQLALAAGWVGGGLIVLRARPLPGRGAGEDPGRKPEWFELRIAVALTQAPWLLVPVFAFLAQKLNAPVYNWFAIACVLIGVGGWPLVAWHLSFLADWASDTGLANRLRGSGWTLAAGSIIFALAWVMGWFGAGVASVFAFFAASIRVLWILALIFFVFSILQMVLMVHWARVNQLEAEARDRRLAERARKEKENAQARIEAFDLPEDSETSRLRESIERAQSKPHHLPPEQEAELAGPSMPKIDAPTEENPYDLEDPRPD